MKTSVCRPSDLGQSELDRWRAIRSTRPELDSPFLAPEFAVAVGHTRPSARVAVVEDGGGIVAFLAFERRALGLAVPIGAGLCDCQAIICEPEVQLDIHQMLAQAGIAAWRFDHLVGNQRMMVSPTSCECASPIIDCSGDFDGYLAAEGRHSRMLLQKERKLGREVGPMRLGFGVTDDAALNKVMEWKSEQYKRTGRPDRFASPAIVGLIRELAATRSPDLSGMLITLHAGDRLVAGEFSLRSETTIAGWFPAHDCEFGRYSTGSLRTLRTIEAAGIAGIRRYDLGKGDEEYKQGLKTGDLQVCEGWVVRHVPLGYARRAMSRPQEMTLGFVLGHPRLRLAARSSLKRIGSARLSFGRYVRRSSVRT